MTQYRHVKTGVIYWIIDYPENGPLAVREAMVSSISDTGIVRPDAAECGEQTYVGVWLKGTVLTEKGEVSHRSYYRFTGEVFVERSAALRKYAAMLAVPIYNLKAEQRRALDEAAALELAHEKEVCPCAA